MNAAVFGEIMKAMDDLNDHLQNIERRLHRVEERLFTSEENLRFRMAEMNVETPGFFTGEDIEEAVESLNAAAARERRRGELIYSCLYHKEVPSGKLGQGGWYGVTEAPKTTRCSFRAFEIDHCTATATLVRIEA